MPIVLRKPEQLKPLAKIIESPSFGSATLFARRPTVREVLEAGVTDSHSDRLHTSLKVFTGWDGVLDENGQPIPFTEAAFVRVCEQYPAFLWAAVDFARDVFAGQGDDSKNLNAPPTFGSAAAPEIIPSSTAGVG